MSIKKISKEQPETLQQKKQVYKLETKLKLSMESLFRTGWKFHLQFKKS